MQTGLKDSVVIVFGERQDLGRLSPLPSFCKKKRPPGPSSTQSFSQLSSFCNRTDAIRDNGNIKDSNLSL